MPLRVLWPHNFDPEKENSGVFMHLLVGAFEAKDVEIQTHYLGNLRHPWSAIRAATAVRRAALDSDVIHSQFGSACGLVSSACDNPKLLSIRGSDFYFLKQGPRWLRVHGKMANIMTRMSMERYDRLIVMSNRMKADVSNHVDEQKIDVIPDGIDMERFRPLPRQASRAALGFPEDLRPWVLLPTLQADNPIKRPELASEAVRHLRRRLPSVEFKLVSGVNHTQMPLLINASSVVLLTSVHEGWPNVIKEALACNVPFVATDVSDLWEVAAEESSCAIAPADPRALADALFRAIQMPRSESLRGRVAHMERCLIASRIHDVYRRVARS